MSRIFLSHSSSNNAEALALGRWLAQEGWDDIFLDFDPERGLKAGERWEEALRDAAHRCEAVIFLVSRAWLGSEWCRDEFRLARHLRKRLFGVLIEDIPTSDLPPLLTREWQVVGIAPTSEAKTFSVTPPGSSGPVEVAFSEEGLHRLRLGLFSAGLDVRFFTWPPADDADRPPYRGLRPLEAEDAGIFFVPDMHQAIQVLWRLLRPAGRLAITTWGPRFFEPANTAFWNAVRNERPDLYKGFNPWDRISEPESLRALLFSTGAESPDIVAENRRHRLRSPEDWWPMVLGAGYRGTIEQLDAAQRERERKHCFEYIRANGVESVEANVLYGLATKSGM